MTSPQMQNLLDRYGVTTEADLLRAIADEYTEECCDPGEEPFLPEHMGGVLDQMLEAEYQRIAGGAYDHPSLEDWSAEEHDKADAIARELAEEYYDARWNVEYHEDTYRGYGFGFGYGD